MSGFDELDAMIASVRRLDGMPREIARLAAPLIEAALQKTANAGTAPDGQPWTPTKKGTRPLQHAAQHITAVAIGATIRVTLEGHDAVHHYGTTRMPRRQVIPDAGQVPEAVSHAVRDAAEQSFAAIIGGEG